MGFTELRIDKHKPHEKVARDELELMDDEMEKGFAEIVFALGHVLQPGKLIMGINTRKRSTLPDFRITHFQTQKTVNVELGMHTAHDSHKLAQLAVALSAKKPYVQINADQLRDLRRMHPDEQWEWFENNVFNK